ncbi:MAG: hypothetical protein PVH40_05975 [Gemmatimonadales bacterium]|jgi:hypothetical protein
MTRPSSLRPTIVLAALLLAISGSAARAQLIEGGLLADAALNVSDGTTFGLGGRLGVYAFRTGDFHWKIDGAFDYLFVSCSEVVAESCWAWQGHVNLLATRSFGSPVQGYGGFGAVYERFRLRGGTTDASTDAAGVNVILGAKFPTTSWLRPFFEVRGALLSGSAENALFFSLGFLFGGGPTEPGLEY